MSNSHHFSVNGRDFSSDDKVVTGREIRAEAGLVPPSDFILIEVGERSSRSIGLEEKIELEAGRPAVFLAFESDRIYAFTVNERGYEWGAPEIAAADIRRYAAVPDGEDLFLDSHADRPIAPEGTVRLAGKGTERIISKPKEKVRIVVNTREKFVAPGLISFLQIVLLAFPDLQPGPNTSFTVSFLKGPDDRPEGSLIDGEFITVRKGMRFNVSATDKS